jgi:hypothetical protein
MEFSMTREEALNTNLVQTGDYFVYKVVQVKETTVVVTPYKGEQWGEQWGEHYEYRLDSLYPYDGAL